MTKKYFFFDIDGTLGLGISSVIPADTLYCLRRLAQAGRLTLSASGSRKVQAGFEPLVSGFVRVPYKSVDSVAQVAGHNKNVAAVRS